MKNYKAECIKCNTVFPFTENEVKTKVKLDSHCIEINGYICCPVCGLKLTVVNMETIMSTLEEYSNENVN
jgi:hypothetical protein